MQLILSKIRKNMNKNEQKVRDTWKNVYIDTIDTDSYGIDSFIVVIDGVLQFTILANVDNYKEVAWNAAAKFTDMHLEKIAEIKKEIKFLTDEILPKEKRCYCGVEDNWCYNETINAPLVRNIIEHEQNLLHELSKELK
jgi:hypothetical protein